mgnify:CR=1 FL=1
MILDEIQEAYFKHRYDNVVGVKLKLSVETYRQMLLQDSRLAMLSQPEDAQLPPMFGRPVCIDHELKDGWAWEMQNGN